MNLFRKHAILTGVFFLITDITAIAGLLLYQPLLTNPTFITSGSVNDMQILIGAFLEILLAVSCIGTALALYPVLKKQSLSMALGYVMFRTLEAIIIMIGILSLLTLLTLRQEFLVSQTNSASYLLFGQALVTLKNWTFLFGPNMILGLNAALLGYLLYQSKLVPRWIGLLALIFGPLIFVSGMLVVLGLYEQSSPILVIIAMPMLAFEIAFSVWLITKGFNAKSLALLTSKK